MSAICAEDVKSSILRINRLDWEKNHQEKQDKLLRKYDDYQYLFIPASICLLLGLFAVAESIEDSIVPFAIGAFLVSIVIIKRSIIKKLLVPEPSDEELFTQLNFEEFLNAYGQQKGHAELKYYMASLDDGSVMFTYPDEIAIIDKNMSTILTLSIDDIRDVNLEAKGVDNDNDEKNMINDGLTSSLVGAAIGGLAFGETGTIAGAVAGSSHSASKAASESLSALGRKNRVTIYTRNTEIPSISLLFSIDNNARDIYGLISAKLDADKNGSTISASEDHN